MKTATLRRLALILAAVAVVLGAASGLLLGHRLSQPAQTSGTSEDAQESAAPRKTPAPEASPAPSEAPEPDAAPAVDADVQKVFDDFIAAQGGTWDLYYESLATGAYAEAQSGHGADARSISASLIKLYVMGAVYDAVAQGRLSHDAVYGDLYSMITVSDNDACNRLVRQLGGGDAAAGMTAVNAFAQSLGCADTQMNRLMLQDNGTENYVSARDCAAILRLICNGACVSETASSEMLDLLRAQTVNDRLPANLPQGVTVAHKTGNLTNRSCGDVGLIFTPGGDYILCVISNHAQNDAQATAAIAALSRTVYDIVNQ